MTIENSKLTDVSKMFDLYRIATGYMKLNVLVRVFAKINHK